MQHLDSSTQSTQKKVQPENSLLSKPAWQKPHIHKLRLSLDTAFEAGSNTDGFTGSSLPA